MADITIRMLIALNRAQLLIDGGTEARFAVRQAAQMCEVDPVHLAFLWQRKFAACSQARQLQLELEEDDE